MIKNYFLLGIIVLLMPLAMGAKSKESCSHEVVEKVSTDYLGTLTKAKNYFFAHNNKEALQAIKEIENDKTFRKKHAAEIQKYLKDKTYILPQEFCDDLYMNLRQLKSKVNELK